MRGLWWLLALALLVTGAAGTYMIHLVLEARKKPTIGDGRDPMTYGFSFESLQVPMGTILASGLPRNSLDVLDLPPRYGAEYATHFRGRDKYVVATDMVIGVEVNGEAMAYPIQILNWHEVVNDTLGGVPILVTYSPLTGTVAAFDRRVGGEQLEFGFSGLLCNTHSLVYDRRGPAGGTGSTPAAGRSAEGGADSDGDANGSAQEQAAGGGGSPPRESLWSPLLGRAISGPAAARGETLRPLEAQFVPWTAWIVRYPSTQVLARDEAKILAYSRSPYGEYSGNDVLRFPTSPLPPDRETRPYKTRVIAVRTARDWVVYDLHGLTARTDPRGIWETEQDGVGLRFTLFPGDPTAAWVESTDEGVRSESDPERPIEFRPTMWFAWYSMRPDDPIR